MKGIKVIVGFLGALLLLSSLVLAQVGERDNVYLYPRDDRVTGYDRLLKDEYAGWFPETGRPVAQRILDVRNLDVKSGDLATPAVVKAQRVLAPVYAWRYGYDLETGEPLLSPYGEERILTGRNFDTEP